MVSDAEQNLGKGPVLTVKIDVDNLQADINLNAKVANLVQLNAGVQIGIKKVNITIAEVDAQVELVVRLGMCCARH